MFSFHLFDFSFVVSFLNMAGSFSSSAVLTTELLPWPLLIVDKVFLKPDDSLDYRGLASMLFDGKIVLSMTHVSMSVSS